MNKNFIKIPKKTGRYSCSLNLETDSILLMKLRSIFNVSSDSDLSDAICKHLHKFARQIEQNDLNERLKRLKGQTNSR